jgi:hypothetical protein
VRGRRRCFSRWPSASSAIGARYGPSLQSIRPLLVLWRGARITSGRGRPCAAVPALKCVSTHVPGATLNQAAAPGAAKARNGPASRVAASPVLVMDTPWARRAALRREVIGEMLRRPSEKRWADLRACAQGSRPRTQSVWSTTRATPLGAPRRRRHCTFCGRHARQSFPLSSTRQRPVGRPVAASIDCSGCTRARIALRLFTRIRPLLTNVGVAPTARPPAAGQGG